jgi:hypothetical protein
MFLCRLAFELRGSHRHGAWPAQRMMTLAVARAKCHAGAGPLERRVGVSASPVRLGFTPRYGRGGGGVHREFPIRTPQLGLKEDELLASLDDGCFTS